LQTVRISLLVVAVQVEEPDQTDVLPAPAGSRLSPAMKLTTLLAATILFWVLLA